MQAQKRAGIRRACLYSATPPQRAGRRSGDPPSADGEPCTGSVRDRCGREIHIAAEQLAGEPLLWTSVKAALAAGASGRRPRFQRMRYAVSCASRWGGLAHRRGLRRGLFAGRFASSVERPAGSPNWPQSAVSGRSPFRGQNGSGPAALWQVSSQSSASCWGSGRRLNRSHAPNGVGCSDLALHSVPAQSPQTTNAQLRARRGA
jgi:hypothetical protein